MAKNNDKISLASLTFPFLLLLSLNKVRAGVDCGTVALTTCTDSVCSRGCKTVLQEPSACGTTYADRTVGKGSAVAKCDRESITF